jgi:hypothetical protein
MERFRFMGPAGLRSSGVPPSRPLALSGTEAGSSEWLNYQARPLKSVRRKLVLAPVLLAVAAVALIWRLVDPEVFLRVAGLAWLYLGLLLALVPLVGAVGWYGATITFPLYEEEQEG